MEQQQNKIYFWHSVLLLALCILGSTVLKFPVENNRPLPVISVLTATLSGGAYLLALNRKVKTLPIMNNSFSKLAAFFLLFTGGTLSIGRCAFEYIDFVDSSRLPNSSPTVLAAVFLVLVAVVGCGHTRTLYMFGLISGLTCAVIFIMTVLFSLQNVNPYRLSSMKLFGDDSLKSAVLLFSRCYFPAGFLPLFIRFSGMPSSRKRIAFGFFFGSAAVALGGICSLSVLGCAANTIDYPFATAAELISFGKVFSRLEGPVQFLYMLCAVTLCAVIYYVVRAAAAAALGGKRRIIGFALLLPAFLVCSVKRLSEFITASFVSWLLLALAVILTLALPSVKTLFPSEGFVQK